MPLHINNFFLKRGTNICHKIDEIKYFVAILTIGSLLKLVCDNVIFEMID